MLSGGEDLDLQATKPRKYLVNRAAITVAIPQDGRTTDRRKRGHGPFGSRAKGDYSQHALDEMANQRFLGIASGESRPLQRY